jgi:hypothetical protein
MKLTVEWTKEIELEHGHNGMPSYGCDITAIPDVPGIYIFARRFGDRVEALYVGKANSIRRRIKAQFNNLKLMRHIESAKSGTKVLRTGEFIPNKGVSN